MHTINQFFDTIQGKAVAIAAILTAITVILKKLKPVTKWFQGFITKEVSDKLQMVLTNQGDISAIMNEVKDSLKFLNVVNEVSLEKSDVMWWISNDEGYTVKISPKTCQKLHLPESAMMQANWINRVPLDYHEPLMKEWRLCVESERDFYFTFPFNCGNGDVVFLTAHAKKAGSQWFGVHTMGQVKTAKKANGV